MFWVGRKVSFSVVISAIVGWGVFSILILQASNTLLQAQAYDIDRFVPLPAGVKLHLQVDKNNYRAGDTVLIALRNDSRLTMWLAEHADGCLGSWWKIETLGADGETWSPLALTKNACPSIHYGLTQFARHSLQTAEWQSVVPKDQLDTIVIPAPVGTYRVVAPYLKGGTVKESDWTVVPARTVTSPSFTLQ